MSDPVADFLAREQDLMNEIDGSSEAPPPAHNPPAQDNVADDFEEFTGATAAAVVDPIPASHPAATDQDTFGDMPLVNGMNGGTGTGSGLSGGGSKGPSPAPVAVPRIEAENIRRWREQQRQMLEKKDEAEEKKKGEWRTAAKKELDEWYKQRDASLKGTQEANRKTEEAHKAAFAKEQADGAQWEEIARMIDSKAASGKGPGGKDVSRLKSLLLHLKEHNKGKK